MLLARGTVLICLSLMAACSTYRDQLARSQRAFDQNDHDRTLAILRDLEPDVKRLAPPEQAQYAYLRGMSDYRIGYKSDARHWLSVAQAYEQGSPGVLSADWKARVAETLDELNGVVYSQGTSGLSTARASDDRETTAASGSKDKDPASSKSSGGRSKKNAEKSGEDGADSTK